MSPRTASSGAPASGRERNVHRAIVAYLSVALPAGSMVRTIPGGDGSRTLAPGYVKGTADILVIVPPWPFMRRNHPFVGFIEVKGSRGRVSDAQVAESETCLRADVRYGVAASIDEAAGLLSLWKIPSRIVKAGKGRAG